MRQTVAVGVIKHVVKKGESIGAEGISCCFCKKECLWPNNDSTKLKDWTLWRCKDRRYGGCGVTNHPITWEEMPLIPIKFRGNIWIKGVKLMKGDHGWYNPSSVHSNPRQTEHSIVASTCEEISIVSSIDLSSEISYDDTEEEDHFEIDLHNQNSAEIKMSEMRMRVPGLKLKEETWKKSGRLTISWNKK